MRAAVTFRQSDQTRVCAALFSIDYCCLRYVAHGVVDSWCNDPRFFEKKPIGCGLVLCIRLVVRLIAQAGTLGLVAPNAPLLFVMFQFRKKGIRPCLLPKTVERANRKAPSVSGIWSSIGSSHPSIGWAWTSTKCPPAPPPPPPRPSRDTFTPTSGATPETAPPTPPSPLQTMLWPTPRRPVSVAQAPSSWGSSCWSCFATRTVRT